MYKGTLIIVDNRLLGRFGSNENISAGSSKFRWLAIFKTKIKAMYYDYFITPSNKAIYFRVTKCN